MYRLLKSLNNNVALVKDEQGQQAVVMGLGIVHNKKKGDIIPDARIEKLFSLKNEESALHPNNGTREKHFYATNFLYWTGDKSFNRC